MTMKRRPKIVDYAGIILGTVLMAFAAKNLYNPASLVTGGFTGAAIILNSLAKVPLWLSNTLLNVPLFLAAFPIMSFKVVKKTFVATAALSIALAFIPEIYFPADDILLTSLFGGIISGAGMGLVFVFQATTGGTDLLAALIHKKIKHRSVVEIMQVLDGIVVIAGISVFGIRKALYALISVFVASKVSDGLIEGLKYSKQAYIISPKAQEISDAILSSMGRGATGINAVGMFSKEEKQIIFCVVPKKEIAVLKELIRNIDPKAFVILSDVREVYGEGFIEKSNKILG